MAVEVRIPTVFRKFTGQETSVEVEAGSVASVIEQLDKRFPGFGEQVLGEDGQLHRFVNVYLNDEDIRYLQREQTPVKPGDSLSIVPSVAGGARTACDIAPKAKATADVALACDGPLTRVGSSELGGGRWL